MYIYIYSPYSYLLLPLYPLHLSGLYHRSSHWSLSSTLSSYLSITHLTFSNFFHLRAHHTSSFPSLYYITILITLPPQHQLPIPPSFISLQPYSLSLNSLAPPLTNPPPIHFHQRRGIRCWLLVSFSRRVLLCVKLDQASQITVHPSGYLRNGVVAARNRHRRHKSSWYCTDKNAKISL